MQTYFDKKTLKNGATLITIPQENTGSATILVAFPVGSRYEVEKINGISHFIEHMMFKGTKRRPTTKLISSEIDAAGAEWNAFTSKEWTLYYIKIDASKLEMAADMLEDMLFHSLFDEKEFQREKGVINEELRMYEDTPTRDVQEEFELIMHENSPLAYKIGGHPNIINALTRKQMITYRDRFYTHEKMVIGVAGAVTPKQVQFVEKLFGSRGKKGKPQSFDPSRPGTAAHNVRLKFKSTDQVHVALGFPAYKKDDTRMNALSLLQNIMGGTMSSRLFIEVRERRGLAYRVRTDVEGYRDCGNTYIHAGLHTERVDEALKVIVAELKKVASKGVTARELDYAKGNVRGSTILSLEDSSAVGQYFVEQQLLLGKIKTPEERLKEYEAVTREDIKRVAKEIFDFKRAKMSVIGPFEETARFEKFLR